jgi:hypothetical protein
MPSVQMITNEGEKRMLKRALKGPVTDLRLRVFKNNVTVDSDMVAADFTEPAFSEYVAKNIVAASWSNPITNGEGKGDIEHAEQEWEYTGATEEDIYGYWVDDPADSAVMWVHKFDVPRQVVGNGSFAITPRLLAYDPTDA